MTMVGLKHRQAVLQVRVPVQSCSYICMSILTCITHAQILVLGFCDNQRDQELIWKILSQVCPELPVSVQFEACALEAHDMSCHVCWSA